jgi:hypothetical protein
MGLNQGLVYLERKAVTFSGTDLLLNGTISGTNIAINGTVKSANVAVTGSFTGVNLVMTGSLTDASGRYQVTSVGSPAQYGGIIQAGSTVTTAGSIGTIVFGRRFSAAAYYVTMSPIGYSDGAGSVVPWVSGTLAVGSCTFVGAASATYNYNAIGL